MERSGWQPSPPIRDAAPAPTAAAAGGAAGRGRPPAAEPPRRPRRRAPRADPDEVTRTLANLADLRDRGAITPEEYEPRRPTCSRGSEPTIGPRAAGPLRYAGSPVDQVPIGPRTDPSRRDRRRHHAARRAAGPRIQPRSGGLSARRRDGQAVRAADAQPDRPFRPGRRHAPRADLHRLGGDGQRARVRLGETDAGQPDEPRGRPARRGDRRGRRARSRTSSWRSPARCRCATSSPTRSLAMQLRGSMVRSRSSSCSSRSTCC